MLPPRPITREAIPVLLPQPTEDGRVSELEERLIRLEGDRQWLGTILIVVVIAGVIGPLAFLWMSDRRADRQREEITILDERVRELDRDVVEMLSAFLEEHPADPRVAAAASESAPAAPASLDAPASPAAPAAEGRTGGTETVGTASEPEDRGGQAIAAQWALALGGRILDGPLDDRERAALRGQWEKLDPDLKEQTLTAMLRRYGLDPEAFFASIDEPSTEETDPSGVLRR